MLAWTCVKTEERGINIADVKFGFGLDEEGDVVPTNEMLTPNSPRFWDREKYVVGQPQESYDKQTGLSRRICKARKASRFQQLNRKRDLSTRLTNSGLE
jgi:phosphoribosylaminoimidazole-succinocarboxamide synthase